MSKIVYVYKLNNAKGIDQMKTMCSCFSPSNFHQQGRQTGNQNCIYQRYII